ncbi:MAG: ATP-binding cassette domain-containing protein [Microscillaceae bacterium]|nr:ATP-binding cassette domain-containing protein [Microscillaceae bacterium]
MEYYLGDKLITANQVNFSVGKKVIIRDIGTEKMPFDIVDLKKASNNDVYPFLGQCIAVLGASGTGKSTLFKLLSGLIKPTQGELLIPDLENNHVLKQVEEGDVGFVQQHYPLSRNQSILAMLRLAAKQGKIKKEEQKDVINSYLEKWGLYEHRNKYPIQLSGGQKQRVAILEQLLCSHYFIIFDEPFSGLDVKNVEDVKLSFNEICCSNDINTVIFSTHDIELAVEIADTIYIIGMEKDEAGNTVDGGTIIQKFDLKTMGLAWKPYSIEHKECSKEISEIIKTH